VLAEFIEEGHFVRHIRRTRLLCRERRDALVESLREHFGDQLEIRGDEAGMFLSAVLPEGVPDREIATRAAERGLRVYPLSRCYLTRPALPGFVLGYGGIRRDEIAAGVRKLREIAEPYLPRSERGRTAARTVRRGEPAESPRPSSPSATPSTPR
jgi:GntR family transcriptional regulator/MocR family aminotransferase